MDCTRTASELAWDTEMGVIGCIIGRQDHQIGNSADSTATLCKFGPFMNIALETVHLVNIDK